MKKKSVSSLVKYLFPPMDNLLKGLIFVVAGSVLAMVESNIWLLVIMAAIALFDFIPDIYKVSDCLSQIKDLKKSDAIDDVITDFASAEKHLGDEIRIGEKYVFGKKSGRVVSYTDIDKVHHFVRNRYGYKRKRFVEIFTLEGVKIKLSKVSDNKENEAEAELVVKKIKEIAPKAEITLW